jgi:uncharacterized membrane protein
MVEHVSGIRLGPRRTFAVGLNRLVLGLARHWLLALNLLLALFVTLPWLAPVFMHTGQTGLGRAIYLLYSTQCHQLPQRSYFLFGPQLSYSLSEIQAAWVKTNNPLVLRQFLGNSEMGWKVAWSDRMVSMYMSVVLGGLLYALLRKHLRPPPWWIFVLLLMPLVIDGGTHMLSDLGGLGSGFRDTNAWLAWLSGNRFPANFYGGDGLGSFNSWMRLLSGLVFGLGIVWLGYPHLEQIAQGTAAEIEAKLQRAGLAAS